MPPLPEDDKPLTISLSGEVPPPQLRGGDQFLSTRWSLILRAGDLEDPDSAQLALSQLCSTYWYPLYAFVRRSGKSEQDAQDMTQGFFEHLLSKQSVAAADPERGRFRSFLLSSIKNFMNSEWRKQNTLKRGGGTHSLSLDAEDAERRYQYEPAGNEISPEQLFDQRWARATLEQVFSVMRDEFRRSGKEERFDSLKGHLLSDPGAGEYEARAEELGLSPSALRTQIYRMRGRFGILLREQIEHTVSDPSMADEELSHLLQALS